MRTDFELVVTPGKESPQGDHVRVELRDESDLVRADGEAVLPSRLFLPGIAPRAQGRILWQALAPHLLPVLDPLWEQDHEVRLLVRIDAMPGRSRQLWALPWEAIGQRDFYPVLSGRCELVRLAPEERPLRGRDGERIRVLFLVGAQQQHPTLPSAMDDLWSSLVALQALADREELDFELAGPFASVGRGRQQIAIPQRNRFTTARSLLELLAERNFHVIHFIGHSDASDSEPATGIAFDVPGQAAPLVVDAKDLQKALVKESGATTLFVLNACRGTEDLAPLLLHSVDHVLAMNAMVPPPFCGRFMAAFYRALTGPACQHRIGPALRLARREVRRERAAWMPTHHAATPHDVVFDPMGIAIERYCQQVEAELRLHRPSYGAQHQCDLEDVFVYLSARVAEDRAGSGEQVREPHVPFGALCERPERRWLLRGEPGAGKTTTLRHHALDLARNPRRRHVPLYVSLPQWLARQREPTWASFLAHAFGPKQVPELQAAVENAARRGEVLVLADGYDELDGPQRAALARLFQHLHADPTWRDVPLVLALRTHTVVEGLDQAAWRLATIEPLDAARQERLLRRRFRLDRPRRVADALARRWAQRLAHELAESTRELATNPLFLSFFAELILRGRRILDVRRHQLLDQILALLLEGEFSEATPRVRRVKKAVRARLARVAWHMSLRATRTVRPRTLERLAGMDLRGLRRVAELAGILVPTGRSRDALWQFAHRQFQEALCAEHWWEVVWRRGSLGTPGRVLTRLRRLLAHRGDAALDHWTEPTALVAGRMADGDGLLMPLMREDKTIDLGLRVFEALDQVRPETVQRVLKMLPKWAYDLERAGQGRKGPRVRVYELLPGRTVRQDVAAMADVLAARAQPGAVPMAEVGAAVECLERLRSRWGLDTDVVHRVLDQLPPLDRRKAETEFVWCRAPRDGRGPLHFTMGSKDHDADDDETPHDVELTPYFIGRTTVTLGQYRLMVPGHTHYWGKDSSLPVTEISWFEAWLFARWLEHQRERGRLPAPVGFHVVLPSEAQWECAARAGTTTRFWSGEEDPEEGVAHYGNWGAEPRPAGEGTENPWGLVNVHGNVREWCQDWYGPYGVEGAPNPTGPDRGRGRVLRGGSCWFDAWGCRSASRDGSGPGRANDVIGFRLALSPPQLGDR